MMRIMLAAVIVAVSAHVFLGWMWSPLGAVLAGFLVTKRGFAAGALTTILAWGGIVTWSWFQAPVETMEMWRVVAGIVGNLPPAATVVVTLGIAGLLGMAAGLLGAALRRLSINSVENKNNGHPERT